MKRLWVALVLLVTMLGGSLLNAWYAEQVTGELIRQLEQAQILTEQQQWENAENVTRQAYHDWQGRHFYLHTTMRHGDTDQILRAFRGVLEYLALRELDQYNAANADLITQLELLAEMEQATVTNVL